MRSIFMFGAGLCIPALLGGCATAPELPDDTRINIGSIVERIRCEIYEATIDYKKNSSAKRVLTSDGPKTINNLVEAMAIGFTISLQVKDTDGVNTNAATSAWGIPISFGLFSFKASAGLNSVSRRLGTYNASMSVATIWKDHKKCPAADAATMELQGSFGIDEWLKRVIETIEETNAVKEFKGIGTTVDYTLTPSVGITPTWAIVRPGNKKYDATLPIGWQREYNNKIDIAVATKGGEPKFTKVCIVDKNGKGCDPEKGAVQFFGGSRGVPEEIDGETQRRLDTQLNNLSIRGLNGLQ